MNTVALFRHFVQSTKTVATRNRKVSRILKHHQQQYKRCLATIHNVKNLDQGVSVQFDNSEEHKL